MQPNLYRLFWGQRVHSDSGHFARVGVQCGLILCLSQFLSYACVLTLRTQSRDMRAPLLFKWISKLKLFQHFLGRIFKQASTEQLKMQDVKIKLLEQTEWIQA